MTPLHAAYLAAATAKDHGRVMACMDEAVRLHSPTKFSPFEGKAMAGFLFSHLFEVLEDFVFTDVFADGDKAALFFTCKIGRRPAEGCDYLTYGPNDLISDFKVLIRPLPAVAALNEIMGQRLARFPTK
jgi:hypothetical protein